MLGIKDIDLIIFSKVKNLFSLSKVNKYFHRLSEDENLWRVRFLKKYGYNEKSEARSWKNFYLLVVYYLYKYNVNTAMHEALKDGMKNLDLVKIFISKGADSWELGMYFAAKTGNQDLVNFFISKGAHNWNWGMYGAAEKGHGNLVDFFISKGANNWGWGRYYSAMGGHQDLVKFFKSMN